MRTLHHLRLPPLAAAVGVLLAAAALLLASTSPAAAHVHVVATSPGVDQIVPHAEVVGLQFDQPVTPVAEGLEVRNAAGERIDLGDVRHGDSEAELLVSLPPDVTPGAHVAAWQVAGGDGHVQEGGWTFVISGASAPDPPSPEPDPPASEPAPAPPASDGEPATSDATTEPEAPAPTAPEPRVVRFDTPDLSGLEEEPAPADTEPADPQDAEDAQLAAAATGDDRLPVRHLVVAALLALLAVAATWPTVRASLRDLEGVA